MFGSHLKTQFILPFSLFLLLFISFTASTTLFGIILIVLFQLTFTFIYSTFTKKKKKNSILALFGIIHGSHCTISTKFYIYLQYFQ